MATYQSYYPPLFPARSLLSCAKHATSAPPPSTAHCSLLTVHWIYTFSAQERDSETGLSYFGSRYYSSDLSIWLSVDPMSDKYASTSSYAYCRNQPIILVDPNGKFDTRAEARQYRKEHHTGGKIHKRSEKDTFSGNYLIDNKRTRTSYTKPKNHDESDSPTIGLDNVGVVSSPMILYKQSNSKANNILSSDATTCLLITSDDWTGFGIADDVAIPIILSTAIITAGVIKLQDFILMSQHGVNNDKLTTDERKILEEKERNNTISPTEKQKLKKDRKNRGLIHSRQSKDK
ncbi:MAG: RHS repeat-associated core domain-containing protein [Bacteroidales bacterium]|nr:RHS repeat-associated core domain-containing protein [Bacteroidales bacterium]